MSEPPAKIEDTARITQLWFHTGMLLLAAWLLAFGAFLALWGPSTGNPAGWTYYIVVPLVLVGGGAAVVGLFRIPYGVVVGHNGLELLYLHRHQHIPGTTIRSLELRGEFVTRGIWLVRRDGTEEPLGLRNPRIVRAWAALRH